MSPLSSKAFRVVCLLGTALNVRPPLGLRAGDSRSRHEDVADR
jgi:hypothetical protein